MSKLKLCPFCGKLPTARSRMAGENEGYATTFIISCECGSQFLAKDDLNKLGWADAKGKSAKCKAVEGWNTRAEPDVPELVRYDFVRDYVKTCNGFRKRRTIKECAQGKYVRYDQAVAMLTAKDKEIKKLKEVLRKTHASFENDRTGKFKDIQDEINKALSEKESK